MLTSKALGCFIQLQISAVPIPNCTVGCTLRCMDFGIIKKYSKIKRSREMLGAAGLIYKNAVFDTNRKPSPAQVLKKA